MLIVIDDAWNAADTRPFLRGGPHCARLLTTRDSATLPRGAAEQPVDQMRGRRGRGPAARGPAARRGRGASAAGGPPRRMAAAAAPRQRRPGRPRRPARAPAAGRAGPRRQAARQARPDRLRRARDPKERRDAVGKTLAAEPRSARSRRAGSAWPSSPCSPRTRRCRSAPSSCCGARQPASTTSTPRSCCSASMASRSCSSSTSIAASCSSTTSSAPGCATGWAAASPQVERSLVTAYRSACDGEWHRLDDAYALTYLPMHLRSVDETAWRRLLLDPRWMARKLRTRSGRGRAHQRLSRYRRTTCASSATPCGSRRMCSAATRRSLRGSFSGASAAVTAQGHRELIASARATLTGGAASPICEPHRSGRAPPAHLRGPRQLGQHRGAAARRPPRPLRLLDRTLKLWDLESGAVLRTFEGHGDRVTAVALLPDGRRALSGSADNTLKLWDLESGAAPAHLRGPWQLRSPPWRSCPTAAAPSPAPRTTP